MNLIENRNLNQKDRSDREFVETYQKPSFIKYKGCNPFGKHPLFYSIE